MKLMHLIFYGTHAPEQSHSSQGTGRVIELSAVPHSHPPHFGATRGINTHDNSCQIPQTGYFTGLRHEAAQVAEILKFIRKSRKLLELFAVVTCLDSLLLSSRLGVELTIITCAQFVNASVTAAFAVSRTFKEHTIILYLNCLYKPTIKVKIGKPHVKGCAATVEITHF